MVRFLGRLSATPVLLAVSVSVCFGDTPRGYAILEEVYKQSNGTNYYARDAVPVELVPYDTDLALKLANLGDGKSKNIVLASVMFTLVRTNPAKAIEWAPPKLKAMKPGWDRLYGAVMVGLAAADHKPEIAREMYALAKDGMASKNTDTPFPPGFPEAMLASLAEKLKNGEADKLADAAIEAASKSGGNERDQFEQLLTAYAEIAGAASPRLVARFADPLPPNRKAGAIARAVQSLAVVDPKAANAMLADIVKVVANDSYRSFGIAAVALVEPMCKTDPAGAVRIARETISAEHRALALALAARVQTKEAALPILREAVAAAPGTEGRTHILSRIAAIAYEIDPGLGKELFSKAKETVTGESGTSFSFYYAQVDPAEARKMIEAEVATLMPKLKEQGSDWKLQRWALAMAAVDVDRALEILKGIPGTFGFDGRRKVAQYVLAPAAVRRTMAFDRWCASDTWIPGTPTGW